MDSAGLLHMVKLLEQSLKVKLNPTVLFEYANVGELAAYLLEQYPMSFLAADKASAAQGTFLPRRKTLAFQRAIAKRMPQRTMRNRKRLVHLPTFGNRRQAAMKISR